MAKAVVTVKLMPVGPEVDLEQVRAAVDALIDGFTKEPGEKRFSVEPIAFGLRALKVIFVMDESRGGTEPLEKALSEIPGVNSVDVIDVRRAIG